MTQHSHTKSDILRRFAGLIAASAGSILIVGSVAAQSIGVDPEPQIMAPTVVGTNAAVDTFEATPTITAYDAMIADLAAGHEPMPAVTGYDAMIADIQADYAQTEVVTAYDAMIADLRVQ